MSLEWTPRERVHMLYLVAGRADRIPHAEELMAQLRKMIVAAELRPVNRSARSGL